MNIDNVIVMSTEPIKETPLWCFLLGVGLILICFILPVISIDNGFKKWWICAWYGLVIILSILTKMLMSGVFDKATGRNVYYCMFKNEVNVQELYENYEVVENKGELWVLKDKDEG